MDINEEAVGMHSLIFNTFTNLSDVSLFIDSLSVSHMNAFCVRKIFKSNFQSFLPSTELSIKLYPYILVLNF